MLKPDIGEVYLHTWRTHSSVQYEQAANFDMNTIYHTWFLIPWFMSFIGQVPCPFWASLTVWNKWWTSSLNKERAIPLKWEVSLREEIGFDYDRGWWVH